MKIDLNKAEEDIPKKEEEIVNKIENRRRPAIPPALPLLPKSNLPTEPVRTGAPISFLKPTLAKGGSNVLMEKQCKQNKMDEVKGLEAGYYTKPKKSFKSMFSQEFKNYDRNPVVYSRYSTELYDPDEKVPESCFKS